MLERVRPHQQPLLQVTPPLVWAPILLLLLAHLIPWWRTSPHQDEPRREVSNPDVSHVKTLHPLAVTVEAEDRAVEVVVEAVEAEKAAVGAVGAVKEVTNPHHPLLSVQARPEDDTLDVEGIVFLTKPRCSNSWNKSCKIKCKQQLGIASQASRPPTTSPPPIKTTVVLP